MIQAALATAKMLEARDTLRTFAGDRYQGIKGAWARGADGAECDRTDPQAKCWCLVAAINSVAEEMACGYYDIEEPIRQAAGFPVNGLHVWQDQPHITHADVMRVLRRALARVEGEART